LATKLIIAAKDHYVGETGCLSVACPAASASHLKFFGDCFDEGLTLFFLLSFNLLIYLFLF
jgi:hypothetical protein